MLNLFIVLKGGISPKFHVPFKGIVEGLSKLSFVKKTSEITSKGLPKGGFFSNFRNSFGNCSAFSGKFKSFNRLENALPTSATPADAITFSHWLNKPRRLAPICEYAQQHKKTAFSLVEMLMSLLVASLLLAALSPVITKNSNEKVDIENMSTPGFQAWVNPGVYNFTVPAKVYELEIQGAGGGGGGGGAAVKKTETQRISSVQRWTVPKGVYKIDVTLVGAGGDGGAGYGVNSDDACETAKGAKLLPNMADNGQDLCVTDATEAAGMKVGHLGAIVVANHGETCSGEGCCWKDVSASACTTSGCSRIVCAYYAAATYCKSGKNFNSSYPLKPQSWSGKTNEGRLMTKTEAQRILDYAAANNGKYLGSDVFNFCRQSASAATKTNLPICGYTRECLGSASNTCMPNLFFTQSGNINLYASGTEYGLWEANTTSPSGVVCVRNVDSWKSYAGAGGSSGARLKMTLDVKPGDVIDFGNLFDGNRYGIGAVSGTSTVLYSESNPEHPYENSSAQLASACIIHWKYGDWSADEYGYVGYCALPGVKGKDATSSGNAEATDKLHKAVCTKYIRDKNGRTPWFEVTEGCSLSVSSNNGMGFAPSSTGTIGGSGAGGVLGGKVDEDGKGVSASETQYGYGGGGGACKRGTRTAGKCSEGGKGGLGYIEVSYEMASPGSGGGAGGAVGTRSQNGVTKNEYLKLKVKPYQSIFVTVGAGGNGGQTAAYGTKGGDSKISIEGNENKFVFEGGNPGGPGDFSGSGFNIIQKYGAVGTGGKYPDPENTGKILSPDAQTSGKTGALNAAGFDGGQGGATRLGTAGACGGNQMLENVCENNLINGLDGLIHNIISNKYGGSGGGGAGVSNIMQGTGGAGAPGYVRIKWTSSEK